MEVIVGGTFDYLHLGHQKMLRDAMEAGDTLVGVTSDEMANNRDREVSSFEDREQNVQNFCKKLSEETGNSFEIRKIDSSDGEETGVFNEEINYLVVSPEEKTVKRANEINDKRYERGLPPLKIKIVSPVYAEDGKRISSTRISDGIINRDGNLIEGSIGISIINDIHYGFFDDKERNQEILYNLKDILEGDDSEYTIALGDLIHENGEKEDKKAFRDVWNVIKENTKNPFFTPGNHDVINLNREYLEEVVGHSIPTIFKHNGKTFILVDSASSSDTNNIGFISDESFQLLENIPDNSYIISHFPLEYTDAYRKSEYYDEYPEAVFPYNKALFEPDYSKIEREIFAHLHESHTYSQNGVNCEILSPFLDITDIENLEGDITNSIKFY